MIKNSYKKYFRFNDLVVLHFEKFKNGTINLTINNKFFVKDEQQQYIYFFDLKNKNDKQTYKNLQKLLKNWTSQNRTKKEFEELQQFFKNEFNYKLNINHLC